MLQLQLASAGSGKTYTLAKKFILFLIAVRVNGGKWRLRTAQEIADGLPRILAITFTNKATNEMKLRIVDKLADLAKADGSVTLSQKEIDDIPYLKDFSKELGVDYQAIGKAAREALAVVLNDYSDFKVSTIDSFFQTVLRTFAYESNLNDSYQVEIDSDFVGEVALDAVFDEINNSPGGSRANYWLHILMDQDAQKGQKNWNVFQKNKNKRESVYARILNAIRRLDSEEFKEERQKLDDYFDTEDGSDPLIEAYKRSSTQIEGEADQAFAQAKVIAKEVEQKYHEAGLTLKEGMQYLDSHVNKLLTDNKEPFKVKDMSKVKSVLKGKLKNPHEPELREVVTRMYDAYSRWLDIKSSPRFVHWNVYKDLIPYLGILGEVRVKMREFLENNNTIQLGETNSMLRRIIGEDDAPFIYERLGSTINHYLIDEFQDTSRLQWDNLKPLLSESQGRGEDNLIIGDPKQSIYRFRNADPSLIRKDVPDAFANNIQKAGLSKEENTNWRSDRTIVEFNNFLFKRLAEEVQGYAKGKVDFLDLYKNVVQFPHNRKREGYVEINFIVPSENQDDDSSSASEAESADTDRQVGKDKFQSIALSKIGPLVSSLIERGYTQKDIAFLVRKNELGVEVVNALMDYNQSLPPEARKIEFISEDSLRVSSSEAVRIIIAVLEKMTQGTDTRGAQEPAKTDWNDIRCNFSFYALRHPEMSVADQVRGFLNEADPEDAVNGMLADMQTVALPALVEAITENFVPEELRQSDAVFIAALQDMVLEYCDRYAADVASFLLWWRTKGVTRSISSPEGTDAVQIMTIHKSKGLEFKCVILPYADDDVLINTSKTEWKWVETSSSLDGFGLPPVLPVEKKSNLDPTEHAEVFAEFNDLYMMDNINSSYVAFTRAVDELYVFTKAPQLLPPPKNRKEPPKKLGWFLYDICSNGDANLLDVADDDAEDLIPPGSAHWNDDRTQVTYGEPKQIPASDESDVEESDKSANDETDSEKKQENEFIISEYGVDSSPAFLHYVEGNDDTSDTVLPDANDADPRSEGNLLHAIMERVKVPEDIHSAVLALKMKGMITSSQASEWEEMLTKAVETEPAAGWFHPSWRVLNERTLLFSNAPDSRPDRIMISPDGKRAVIVDYKFGAVPEGNEYVDQVTKYVNALREALEIRDVDGFIWYLRLGKIVKV